MHVHTWLVTYVAVGRQLEGLFFPSTMCVLENEEGRSSGLGTSTYWLNLLPNSSQVFTKNF